MVAVAGVTATEATGTTSTVTFALPAFPSLVAVIVADPAALLVARPLGRTLATAVWLLAQVTVRPVGALPADSFGCSVSCTVCTTYRFTGPSATCMSHL